jgi:peptide/nickel transport system permease protein
VNRFKTFFSKLPIGVTFAGIFLIVITASSFLGKFWTPFNPEFAVIEDQFQPPNSTHWFGTDSIGRDLLSIILKGLPVTLLIALSTVLLALLVGCILGLAIAKFPVLASFFDLWIAFPVIILAFALTVYFGQSAFVIILACSIGFAIAIARVTAPKMRQLLKSDFVKNLKLMGASAPQIWFKHVFPNLAPLLIVQSSLTFVGTILAEAGLTYLGLGVPNSMFSLGQALASGATFLRTNPSAIILPGLLIVLINLSVSTICDFLASSDWEKM